MGSSRYPRSSQQNILIQAATPLTWNRGGTWKSTSSADLGGWVGCMEGGSLFGTPCPGYVGPYRASTLNWDQKQWTASVAAAAEE